MQTPVSWIIACGALAKEMLALRQANTGVWSDSTIQLQCLPAKLHNTPQLITPALRAKLKLARQSGVQRVFIGYGDCGSGGALDRLIAEYNHAEFEVTRLPGAHCYEFYAGAAVFQALSEAELGTFYLTDFLARHFERLIWQGLGLDRHPQLLTLYFGHYRELVYLAQTEQPVLATAAAAAASRLGLNYQYRYTGYGDLATRFKHFFPMIEAKSA